MHITIEPGDSHAVLHLRGEFDTYYVPLLQDEIEALRRAGVTNVVLNLRLVKFINSTALGAILKASKALTAAGGRLVISRPSAFCRDILEKVGLDRVVPVFGSDEEAVASLRERTPPAPKPSAKGASERAAGDGAPFAEDPSSVLFRLEDVTRLRHFIDQVKAKNPVHNYAFGENWAGVGRMSGLDENGLRFTWNGGNTDLSPFDMGQMLAVGTRLSVKFRLPLLQRGYCEADCEVSMLEERSEGVKVGCRFSEIDEATRNAVRQYAKDMAFLKEELRKATDA